jgi:uncharacterized membrane protein
MDIPKSEQRRLYIKSKISALQKRRKMAVLLYFALSAIIFLMSLNFMRPIEALILFFIASAWSHITRYLCDVHIDILSALKLDLDRDLHLDLDGFETTD